MGAERLVPPPQYIFKMKRSLAVLTSFAAAALLFDVCLAQTPPPAGATNFGGFRRGGLSRPAEQPADQPAPRTDSNSQIAHAQLLEKARKGGIDIYFEGDSITRRWGASDPAYKENLANWTSNFFGWNAADFGWGADLIQHILWRLENGELDGCNP